MRPFSNARKALFTSNLKKFFKFLDFIKSESVRDKKQLRKE